MSFLPSGLDVSIKEEATGIIMVRLPELKTGEFYSYLLTAPGYEEVADTGVMHRVDLIMNKAVISVEGSTNQMLG